MIHSPTRRASLALLGLALAPLAACAPASSAHGLTIVATTTQICDYVTQIAAASSDPRRGRPRGRRAHHELDVSPRPQRIGPRA